MSLRQSLHYLYRGQYPISSSSDIQRYGLKDGSPGFFKTHAQLYGLASMLEIDDLSLIAITQMEKVGGMSFRCLIGVAKLIYPKLCKNDRWFTTHLKKETRRALADNPKLSEELWILDVYKSGGTLAVDPFTSFVAIYKTVGASLKGENPQEAATSSLAISITSQKTNKKCSDQTKHLDKKEFKLQWEDLVPGRDDRERVLEDIQSLISTLTFSTLVNLRNLIQDGAAQCGDERNVRVTTKLDSADQEANPLPSVHSVLTKANRSIPSELPIAGSHELLAISNTGSLGERVSESWRHVDDVRKEEWMKNRVEKLRL